MLTTETRDRTAIRRRPLLMTAATAVAVLVSACSGGSDDASSPTSSSASASATATAGNTAGAGAVVDAANAFTATLTDDQKTAALLEFTEDNATAWSNLPCGSDCRVGIQVSELSEDQLTAAKTLLQASLGSGAGTGYDQAMQILLADDHLGSVQSSGGGTGGGAAPSGGTAPGGGAMPTGAMPTGAMPSGGAGGGGTPPTGGGGGGGTGGGGGYSSDNYYLALLGTPGATGTWQLHFGGHHLAVNITYVDGVVAGATPYFVGVEPTTWTADDGTTYAPLDVMKNGMLALTASLSADQLTAAKLSESYTDVLLGPDGNGQFPETKAGLAVSELSDDQKQLVMAAMTPWVSIADDATAADLLATYESELDQTYVSYSGDTGLTAQGDYVRIDGPSVWIEFVCQNGVVISNQIHYHTVYRDHTRDYGGELSF